MTRSDETRRALDRAACGLLQTDDTGTFIYANTVFCQWLGYEAPELVGARRLQDLLTMGGRIFHQTHWTPLLRMQGSVSEVKLELLSREGVLVPMVLNAIRREEAGGVVHEVAAFIARDRDHYEQELVRSRKRLEELHDTARDRALYAEQMIGIVSHDLRSPLAAISVAADLLAHAGAEAIGTAVPRIVRAVDRSSRLIADLLDFTQARVGTGIPITVEAVDLHRAVADTVDELRGTYPARSFVHTTAGSGDCEVDVNRLGQLIGNLVANAVAYGAPGTPITLASGVADVECTVSVHNDGPPIPPAVATTIFDAMTRGTTEGRKARSVGLGLYIVREIARAHGGTASVASSAERGTAFTICLPRRPAKHA